MDTRLEINPLSLRHLNLQHSGAHSILICLYQYAEWLILEEPLAFEK